MLSPCHSLVLMREGSVDVNYTLWPVLQLGTTKIRSSVEYLIPYSIQCLFEFQFDDKKSNLIERISVLRTRNRHVTSRHDSTRSTCRARRAVLFDKLDTAKMHGLDTSNVTWRAKWNSDFTVYYFRFYHDLMRFINNLVVVYWLYPRYINRHFLTYALLDYPVGDWHFTR